LSPEGKGREGKVRFVYGRSSRLGFSQSLRRGRGRQRGTLTTDVASFVQTPQQYLFPSYAGQ